MRNARHVVMIALTIWCFASIHCDRERRSAAPLTPPARTTHHGTEAELATVTLSPEAEARLGIETAVVESRVVPRTRTVGGEVLVPPGQVMSLAAPVAATVTEVTPWPSVGERVLRGRALLRLRPVAPTERDAFAVGQRAVETARARVELLDARLTRSEQLLRDRAGSVRSIEEARADRDTARAELSAARSRLSLLGSAPLGSDVSTVLRAPRDGVIRAVSVAPGQSVPSGAALIELVTVQHLWVRVGLYPGDLSELDPAAPAQITHLGSSATATPREAPTVTSAPSGDPNASTVDLFFALPNDDGAFRPGERVEATLRYRGGGLPATVVPTGCVVYDVHGGTWVYERIAPRVFSRRRVEQQRVVGALAVLSRGVSTGAVVVRTGASELFGTEFGAGH